MRWKAGEPLYLSGEVESAAKERQEAHREASSREGVVRAFLERRVPEDWSKWPLDKRRIFWVGSVQGEVNTVVRERVCALEVWCEAFGGAVKEIRNADAREINAIIAATPGWSKAPAPIRCGDYGVQRGFERNNQL